MQKSWLVAVVAAFLVFLTGLQVAAADTIYVDTGATGAGDGTSWTDAYTSLQDALQEARTNGTSDEIWVAAGTYYPDEGASADAGDRTASFQVESGIDLHGRFEGTEETLNERTLERGMNETILSGEIQQDGTQSNNAYTVLRLTGGAVGEVQVTGGQANGTGAQGEGGGVYITGGTLHHAVLTGNEARRGSALYAENSPAIEVVRATGNHATQAGTFYLEGGAATLRYVTIADNTAGDGATGIQFDGSDAVVEDFAFGTETTNAIGSAPTRVTATFDGTTDQESQTLPNADITIRNADADTTVGTTTSDTNGDYSFTTTYPDNKAYTAEVISNTSDHQADTTTVSLGTSDNTYTSDFNLERLIYDITVNTDDANTNNPVSADGDILNNGTSLASYTTEADGETTVEINNAADNVSSEANTANYDPDMQSITLGASEDISVTNALPPIQYTFTGNVNGDNGDLNDADITLDDGDGNQLTTTTNTNGDYNFSGTVNDGLQENETVDITADKNGYNASTKQSTADPDNRDKTTNFTLTPATINYTIEGDVTSSDGDTVTDNPIHIVSPGDDTVDTTTPDNTGFYTASTTESELGGNQADIESNPAGYDPYSTTKTLSEGTNIQDITLQEILRDYEFNTEDGNGNTLGNVSLDIDETTTGDRDVTTLTTDGSGNASTTLSVDEQIIAGDELTFTASKDGYNNAETTDIVDTETETITLSLQEQTTTYDITGTLTDEDGDQLANEDVLIQTTSDNTVASTTTTNDGSYSVSVTQDELGGDTGEVQSNPTGYNLVETTKTFNEGTNTVDLTLPLTEYTRTFNVDDANDNPLSNASIDGDETTNGDRDVFTASTNTSGEHTETLTIDDMVVDGDQLEYQFNKDGYNAATKTETLTDTTKTINADLDEQNTTDRITITFNPKTVGNSLYSGGYSGELDYTVSTDDTTFTTTGSTTADVPLSNGDNLEISHGDPEYISTFAMSNTDTEQPPFQVSGFPDEPDYQSSSTVSIPKSNVVNQYQIRGIPSTSPEGKDTKSTYGGDLGAGRWTTRDGYDEIKGIITTTRIDNGDDVPQSVIDKMSQEFSTATSQMSFLPITQTRKTFSEVQDIFNNRGVNFNYTAIDGGTPSNKLTTSSGYAERGDSQYAESESNLVIGQEIYESFTGTNNLPVFNDDGTFNKDGKWVPRVIYSLESQNTF
jgi:hypothetical protein